MKRELTLFFLGTVLLIFMGMVAQYMILKKIFGTEQPVIVCQGGYQVMISKDKKVDSFYLVDKHDRKIPCR